MNSKRQAEEALRASEERFRTLTEISSDWFWETDTEHRFTFLSLDVSLDKRTTRADVLGKTRWELFPNMMTPAEWEVHHETLAARRPFQEVLTRAFNEAETEVIAYFNISGLPKYDATGKFTGYRGVGRDVTRIKRAEQAIADSEAKFRLITQNMRDIIALLAPDGKTLYLSPSFTRVTGHGADTSLRENPESLFHPDDFLRAKEAFTRCVLGDGKETALSYRFRHADGHYIWFENQMHLVHEESGKRRHVQVSARDITARQLAEQAVARKSEELKAANTALGKEVRNRQELERNILITIEKELEQLGLEVHDELGQNLTGIALLTKTLCQKLAEKNIGEASLAIRISDLVNRAIGHTRMIAHGLSPYIWGDDGLVAALKQLANDVNSLGTVKCETRIPNAVGISDEVVALTLYRVAQEAVNNALKHSRAGKIRISLAQTTRGIEMAVSDDGVGDKIQRGAVGDQHSLHSIRHRCHAIDAKLTIGNGARGGTIVRVLWRGAESADPELLALKKETD